MVNLIFCGYRQWAIEIIKSIGSNPKINVLKCYSTNEKFIDDYNKKELGEPDLILFIGWSWIVPKPITDQYLCLGIHPSDLPLYRGGSPLQHQIINGLKNSKVSLITLSDSGIDSGDIWMKEEFDLTGDSITDIFSNLIHSSVVLLERFFENYPLNSPEKQNIKKGSFYKRRTPDQSRISRDTFVERPLAEIYDFIRALTDPYPNAYIEDEFGTRLYITGVKLVKSDAHNE